MTHLDDVIIDNLRQALWDIYGLCGEDQDGRRQVPHVDALSPPVEQWAMDAVRALRQAYEKSMQTYDKLEEFALWVRNQEEPIIPGQWTKVTVGDVKLVEIAKRAKEALS